MSHAHVFKQVVKRRKKRRGKRIYTKYVLPRENLKTWRKKL